MVDAFKTTRKYFFSRRTPAKVYGNLKYLSTLGLREHLFYLLHLIFIDSGTAGLRERSFYSLRFKSPSTLRLRNCRSARFTHIDLSLLRLWDCETAGVLILLA